MTTEDTSYAVLSAPEMDGMFTATAVTEPECSTSVVRWCTPSPS